jgi:uncharacterized membrane protein/predicted DsbA family dithiol-disulfide isomerase
MASPQGHAGFSFCGVRDLCGTTVAFPVSSKARTFAFVCALAGLAAMLWSSYVHHRLLFDPRYASFCDINSTVSCSEVLLSRYSTAYGVPVSIFGAIWFAGALVLVGANAVGRESLRENVPGYLFALSTAGLAVVLYLAYISFAVLKVYCPLCLTADAAVVGLFIVSGAATPFPMTTLPKRAFNDFKAAIVSPSAITVVALFIAGSVSAVVLFARESAAAQGAAVTGTAPAASADRRSEFERWYTAQPRVPLIVPTEGAKVLIVDFSDFQCPYCRQAYVVLKPIIEKYNAQQPNTVRLVLKDFPLDSKCNANVQNGGPHPAACEAAVAVRLAKAKNREQAMEDWLFSNQPAMTSDTVRNAAREVGQVTDFDAKYSATIADVKGDIAFGHTLAVSATPTMFINGVKIPGVLAPQFYDQAIAFELQRAAAQK